MSNTNQTRKKEQTMKFINISEKTIRAYINQMLDAQNVYCVKGNTIEAFDSEKFANDIIEKLKNEEKLAKPEA